MAFEIQEGLEIRLYGAEQEYSTENIMEQCMTCGKVDALPIQNSDFVFSLRCKENHTPHLKFTGEGKGDTFYITQTGCPYRVRTGPPYKVKYNDSERSN